MLKIEQQGSLYNLDQVIISAIINPNSRWLKTMSLILTHVTVQCPCSSLNYVSYYNSTVLQGLEIFPIHPAYEGKKKKKRGGPRVGVFVGLKVAFIISSYIT